MLIKIFTFILLFISFNISAQNILLINDNDNITQNTDTFLVAIQNSNYNSYTYYNLADSSAMPSATYLADFDILIYYASTDGAGLGIWDSGQSGNNAVKGFLADGGRAWIIGSDILYAGGYPTPTTFSTTSFAYEFMGLESYDSQSYGDDGNQGVSEISTTTEAPSFFPNTLAWTLGSLWWVDGVTNRPEGKNIYEMGPSSYPLYQSVCMTHYSDFTTDVLCSFFDPALILGSTTNRIDFINASIDYLWQYDLGIEDDKNRPVKLYPTIAEKSITIELENNQHTPYEIFNAAGALMQSGVLDASVNLVDIHNLSTGLYFVKTQDSVEKFIIK